MARKKKKKKHSQQQKAQLSPENYIRKKARNLPLYQCYINPGWKAGGITNIFVARKHKNENVTVGVYLVDLHCLGIKDTFYYFNIPEFRFEEIIHRNGAEVLVPCDYHLAHNIIYGAKEYAEKLGFSPHKIWSISQFILEPDDDRIPVMDIEFGRDGKPFYFSGPHDDIAFGNRVINTLNKSVGKGNYIATIHSDDGDFNDLDFEDNEDDEELYNEDEKEYHDVEYNDEDEEHSP